MKREVTKAEFDNFIKAYPNELSRDVTGISEPPTATYNDFSSGNVWPESVVASIILDYLAPNGEYDASGKYYKYYLWGEI